MTNSFINKCLCIKKVILLPLSLFAILLAATAQQVIIKDSAFAFFDKGQTPQLQSIGTTDYNANCSKKIYHYAYVDLTSNQLVNSSQSFYEYYPNDSLYQITTQMLYTSDTGFTNYTRETFTYTAKGAIATDYSENWNGVSAWVPALLITNTYDAGGRITEIVTQTSDGLSPLINSTQTINEYNAGGHITKNENLLWDAGTNAWVPLTQTLFTYDANELLITSTD